MPSVVGHALLGGAAGWAAPRRLLSTRAVLAGAVCASLPDIDAVGFRLGIPYGDWLGHRGFSHSLLFAFAVAGIGTLLSFAVPRFKGSRSALFAFLTACTVSHGLLDAMTNGGLGVAFLSPFSNERYFLPWRPIVVAPLSPRRLLSTWGLQVLGSEALFIGLPVALLAVAKVAWQRSRTAKRAPEPDEEL